jgi:hypothetical protein
LVVKQSENEEDTDEMDCEESILEKGRKSMKVKFLFEKTSFITPPKNKLIPKNRYTMAKPISFLIFGLK